MVEFYGAVIDELRSHRVLLQEILRRAGDSSDRLAQAESEIGTLQVAKLKSDRLLNELDLRVYRLEPHGKASGT